MQTLRARHRTAGITAALLATLALVVVSSSHAQAPVSPAAAPKVRTLGGGAWSWFGDPRGVHHVGAHRRTYLGWVDVRGTVKVASFDHNTRLRTTAVMRWRLDDNDHANPSLHVLPSGKLMVFYNKHAGPAMYYRISTRREDVRSWGPEKTIPTNTAGLNKGYSYPNPIWLSESKRLWLFWRGGNWQPTFASTKDAGGSWTQARTLIRQRDQRPYVKYASNGRDKIHFAFTEGNPGSEETNINYAYYKAGALYRADGTRIKGMANLPLSPKEADSVFDTDEKTWVHDIALDRDGRPIIVFTTLPSETEHHYRYARWTGSAWRTYPVTPAGGSIGDGSGRDRYYSGGITLDHENTSVVYLSREVKGVFEVETWRTPDRGRTWQREAVTSGSSTQNVRPISPRGLRSFFDDMSVVWMRGAYSHYLNYQTDITTRLLNGGNIPPIAEASKPAPVTGPGVKPRTMRFSAARSRDPDGTGLAYAWNFGDGTGAPGKYRSHTYARSGRYYATLTVTDEDGGKDVFVTEVNV
ncbi:MAG: hypothetical protein AVDCRST_MAG17-2231 [uncultured Solirubrobacterales bacterium]|uniref:PKD domain-containing protein n=1 Tax=uncultured Solirubrobacterales bacterium TaxID=768556 RepID=A0A6J4T799_9ACTN|nr:MAG: hypothetical protein AVDCRST_MAG17-2231 [uncultured Solirubrobacterales bacterium]